MRNDILRPVSVVGVKVPNRNPLDTTVEGGEGRDGYVAEITETHRPISRRVMPGRAHEAKGTFSADAGERGVDRGAGGRDRMLVDPWISRRIGIKIVARSFYLLHMIRRMGAQQITLFRRLRLAPFPITMSIFQYRDGARDPLGALRMAGSGVFNAMWSVENDHRSCKMSLVRIFDYLEC
jgi:hypothetical protein